MNNSEPKRISEQLKAHALERKQKSEINSTYFLRAYGFSLLVTVIGFFLFRNGDTSNYGYFLVTSFLLYPFAAVIYDRLIGFRLKSKLNRQTTGFAPLTQLHYVLYLIIYFFSVFLAPFGIIYLIGRAIYQSRNKRQD